MPRVKQLLTELGLDGFFETSSKEGTHVAELSAAIQDAIYWDTLPAASSSVLLERIRHHLLVEKNVDRLLATSQDLFRDLQRRWPDEDYHAPTAQAEFAAALNRLEGRGLIRHLRFGDFVLLRPEILDGYASSLVQAAKDEPDGLGIVSEDDALAGRFEIPASERIKAEQQEKLVLIATVEELLRHEVALKEVTDRGGQYNAAG
jgi:hypothetical protein